MTEPSFDIPDLADPFPVKGVAARPEDGIQDVTQHPGDVPPDTDTWDVQHPPGVLPDGPTGSWEVRPDAHR